MVLSNVITNNTLDVIEIHSNSNLVLETNTQIFLNTSNILINYIPFNDYIRNIVFDEAITMTIDSNNIHTEIGVPGGGSIDITHFTTAIGETSAVEIDEIYCSGISATHTHVNSCYHYINVSAASNIHFNIGSPGNNSSNIVYKNDTTEVSLSNYIYKVVNNQGSYNTETLSFPSIASGNVDITNMGTYIGNKIITSKISTSNAQAFSGVEPRLKFDSETAINFVSNEYAIHNVNVGSNIFIGQTSLDTLIKSQLNETGMFNLTATMSSGQDIGMELDSFTHTAGYTFEYDVEFYIYLHDDIFNDMIDAGSVDSLTVNSLTPFLNPSPYAPLTFYGQPTGSLVAGQFYTVLGKFTNKRTGTVVENIQITGGERVATIQNVVINSVTLIKEDRIRIEFVKHATQVSAWNLPNKWVKFYVQIGDDSPIVYYLPIADTTITQDLSQPVDPTTEVYNFNISSVEAGYGQDYIKIDAFKTTLPTEIKIISNHYNDLSSTFEMSQVATLSPHTFQIPNQPSNIRVESKMLKWDHTNNDSKLNDNRITYNVKRYSTITTTLNYSTKEYDLSSSSPYYGDWYVEANIAIYSLNIWSGPLTVNQLVTPSISGLTFNNSPRQFYFDVTMSSFNVDYTISNQTLTHATSSPLSTKTRLYFTFNNGISSGNKTLNFTVTDNYGFTVTGSKTESLTINLHSLSSVNFVLDTPTSYSYSFVYNSVPYTNNEPSNATLTIPTIPGNLSLNSLDYTFEVTIKDENYYGFTVSNLATFTVTLPTIGTASTDNIGPYSINVLWDTLGTNGTPDQKPLSVVLLYKKTTDATYTIIDISELLENNYQVSSLDLNTEYNFKIEKTYSNYNSVFSETDPVSTLPVTALPTAPVIDTTNTIGRNNEIDVVWTEGSSNGSATGYTIDITYTIEYKLNGSPTWIEAHSSIGYNSPQTISGLISNRLYNVRVTKIATIDGFDLITEDADVDVETPAIEPGPIVEFRNKTLSYTDMELTWDSLGIDGDYTLNNVIIEYGENTAVSYDTTVVKGTIIVPVDQRIDNGQVTFTIPPEQGINMYYFKLKKVYSDTTRNKEFIIRVSLKMYPPYFISYSINEDFSTKHATNDSIHIRFKYDGPPDYLTNQNLAFEKTELFASYDTNVDLTDLSFGLGRDLKFITDSFDYDTGNEEHYVTFVVERKHNPWTFILLVRSFYGHSGQKAYRLQVQTTRPNKITFDSASNFYPSGVKEINVRVNFITAYDGNYFLQNYDDLSEPSIQLSGGSITEIADAQGNQGKDVKITFTNANVNPFTYYAMFSRITVATTRTYQGISHSYSIQSDHQYVPDIPASAPSFVSIEDSGKPRTAILNFRENDNGNDFPLYYTIERIEETFGEGVSHGITVPASIHVDISITQIEWLDEEMINEVDILIPGESYRFRITKHTKRSQTVVLSNTSSYYIMPNITKKIYFVGINNTGQSGGATPLDTLTSYDAPMLIDSATFALSWYLPEAMIYSNINGIYYILDTSTGRIQSTGNNEIGLLGDGNQEMLRQNNSFRYVVKDDGTILENVKKIYVGRYIIYAVTSDLKIYSWGQYQTSTNNILGYSVPNEANKIGFTAKQLEGYYGINWFSSNAELNISIGVEHVVVVRIRNDGKHEVVYIGFQRFIGNGDLVATFFQNLNISVIIDSHLNFNYRLLYPICTETSTYFLYRGYLYAGGENEYGQLANGQHDSNSHAISLCSGFEDIQGTIKSVHPTNRNIYVLTNDNNLYGIGQNVNESSGSGYVLNSNIEKTMIHSLTNVKKVRATRFGLEIYAFMEDDSILFSGTINSLGGGTEIYTGFINQTSSLFNNTNPISNMANTDFTSVYFN